MKKSWVLTVILSVLVAAFLLALPGCAAASLMLPWAQAEEISTATNEAGQPVYEVSNVNDFLAALGSDREIILAPGKYDLSRSSGYGAPVTSGAYCWLNAFNGYELQLNDLENLTIRGSGAEETQIIGTSSFANILNLSNCSNITLSDFTAGHDETLEACEAGVLALSNCKDLTLANLGVFGCGAIGVHSLECENVFINDCHIYECSGTGVLFSKTTGITMTGCTLEDLGTEQPAAAVIDLERCSDVWMEDNLIRNNYADRLIYANDSLRAEMVDNVILNNRFIRSVFCLISTELVFDSNTMENNNFRVWGVERQDSYTDICHPLNKQGEPVEFGEPQQFRAVKSEIYDVTDEASQRLVRVTTADEFLEAIAPNTKILLESPEIDLSTASGYGKTSTSYYRWEDPFDGPELIIQNVENLTIAAEGEDVKDHVISAVPRYAYVLTFENCEGIKLTGFTVGHTREPGHCMGGVVKFRNSEKVMVDDCGMYGCGTWGVSGEYSVDMQILNSDIYECSYGGVDLYGCENVMINDCTFRDLGEDGFGSAFRFTACRNVTMDGYELDGNYRGN